MGQFLQILAFVNALLPLVLQTVKLVEDAFPQGGQGAAKLAMVQDVVQHAIAASSGLQVTAAQVMPVLAPIVGGMVAMLNATGAFKKALAAPAMAALPAG